MASSKRKLLVTGASGHLGRRVVEILLASGKDHIIAATRNPDKIKDLEAKGAELRKLDFDDAASMATAFAGVERMLLISTDSLGGAGQRMKQQLKAVDAAIMAGVTHVTYTSLAHPDPSSVVSIAPDHWATEEALRGSNVSSSSLRNNLYTDYLIPKLNHAIKSGQLMAASGDGATAYVTREDCAQAAAGALSAHDSGHKTYAISGPAALTQAQIAKLASELAGKEISYVPVSPEGLKAGMEASGLPSFVADMMVSFDLSASLGQLGEVSSAVQDLSGQAPQSVAHFMEANKAAFLA